MKVNRTPEEAGLRVLATADAECCCDEVADLPVLKAPWSGKERPVISAARRRRNKERHRRTRVTRAGRECQVRIVVPVKRMTRRGVIIYNGGSVRRIQIGETRSILMKRVVNAGRVVAEVGVRCVERKSVIARNGSSRILQRDVNSDRVSTISSKDLCCVLFEDSNDFACFSPVADVDDRGEYRLEYIPRIKNITSISGPAYRMTYPAYNVAAQKAATSRYDSHGSFVVHDIKPTSLFSGRRYGCECASPRVICGGVATSKGDFLCTITVDLCFDAAA